MPEVKIKYHGISYKEYVGRLLGLITDTEFYAIKEDTAMRNRIITAETVPVAEINQVSGTAAGMRLAFSLRQIEGQSVFKKMLITERIEMISSFDATKKELAVIGPHDHWFVITETE